jgi:hypothetical protein
MKLKDYLKKINSNPYRWARENGLNPVQTWKYSEGKAKRPDSAFAAAVEKATRGMVSRMDILYPED